MQKQPPEMFCKKKTPVLESLFDKVAANPVCSFTKTGFPHTWFRVKFAKF